MLKAHFYQIQMFSSSSGHMACLKQQSHISREDFLLGQKSLFNYLKNIFRNVEARAVGGGVGDIWISQHMCEGIPHTVSSFDGFVDDFQQPGATCCLIHVEVQLCTRHERVTES